MTLNRLSFDCKKCRTAILVLLKASMPSQDSSFLKVGMPVQIKFDAYPFQDYGIVPGFVARISPDSKVIQAPGGTIETYDLEIALEQQYVQNGNKRIPLTAGQTATAEVIIRHNDYFRLELLGSCKPRN